MIQISVADDYTKRPGGRFISDGEYSGQDFRERLLLPKYMEAKREGEKLCVNLDGGYGYGSSFLEEAFGGLVRELGSIDSSLIEIVSEEEPQLVEDVRRYIIDAINNQESK